MRTLLIADDERTIREGIYQAGNWSELGFDEVYLAADGLEAYQMICSKKPDVAIVDIIMPEMTGIELIERTRAEGLTLEYIILSGHDEFRYAQTALRNQVRCYLLKPCSFLEIKQALAEVTVVLDNRLSQVEEREQMRQQISQLLPQVTEQLFRDYISGAPANPESRRLLQERIVSSQRYQIILFSFPNLDDYLGLLSVKKAVDHIFQTPDHAFGTLLASSIVVICPESDPQTLEKSINAVMDEIHRYQDAVGSAAVSKAGSFDHLPNLYREALNLIKYAFYFDDGSMITAEFLEKTQIGPGWIWSDALKNLSEHVQSGNHQAASATLDQLLGELRAKRHEPSMIRTLAMEIYLAMIRHCSKEDQERYLQNLVRISAFINISQLDDFLKQTARAVTEQNYNHILNRQEKLIHQVLSYVTDHLKDEELSLNLIARNVLFINADYLGKLFKKIQGIKFNDYLLAIRMEKAKEILQETPDLKIYQIADAVGMGKNTTYFSQLFRKYTGRLPSDFRDQKD